MLTRLWKNNGITLVMNIPRQVREKVKTDGIENHPLCIKGYLVFGDSLYYCLSAIRCSHRVHLITLRTEIINIYKTKYAKLMF